MPYMNSLTYIYYHNVLSNKTNQTEIHNCNGWSKDTCPLLNICHTKSIIYQVYIDCHIAGYKQKCSLAHVKLQLKNVSEIIRSHSTTINIKNDTELSKEFWEIKQRNGIPKIIWKASEHAVLLIHTIGAAFYV